MAYYNTKYDDLSEGRKKDFLGTLNALGKTREWGDIALTINPIEDWEHYGFGGFRQAWLEQIVSRRLTADGRKTVSDAMYEIGVLREQLMGLIDAFNKLYDDYAANMDECEERLSRLEKMADEGKSRFE